MSSRARSRDRSSYTRPQRRTNVHDLPIEQSWESARVVDI